jgi:beta-glucanase (GH16 family)
MLRQRSISSFSLLGALCFCVPLWAQLHKKVQVTGGSIPAPDTPWHLVFHDEFSGSKLDTTKWITYYPYDAQGKDQCPYCRTHGAEGQVYLDRNVQVGNGHAQIRIQREPVAWMGEQRPYSSGMIHTRPPWKFKFGRFEMRCRLPRGMGFWPAFWLYGWGGNEIDIFELGMQDPELQYTNVHRDFEGGHFYHGDTHYGPDYTSDFHVFALEWDPWSIRWLVNGQQVRYMARLQEQRRKKPVLPGTSLEPGVYLENLLMPEWPLDVIANVAVGVDGVTPFTGSPTAETVLPASMDIDYIRVYQRQPQPGMNDLCATARISGPDWITGPALYRFEGPFVRLDWNVSEGLNILERTADGILVAPLPGVVLSRQWVEARVDSDGKGPCPATTIRRVVRK